MTGAPQPTPPAILVVDDDRGLARLIEKTLQREGFSTAAVGSGAEALEWLQARTPQLMLLDLKLQDQGGAELVAELEKANRRVPFVIITGQGDERVAVEMMKRGALDYLVKDVDFLQFIPAVVKRSLDRIDRERRLAAAEEQVRLIGSVVEQGFSAVLITTAEAPDPVIVYINPAFARATGYKPGQVVGKRLSTLEGLERIRSRLASGFPRGARFVDEFSSYHTTEGERWGEWRVGPVEDRSGKAAHWLIIFRDITEQKRLEKEILEISEEERQRIGHDLHDGLCQQLAGIELMSQVLEQSLAPKSKSAAARAGEIAGYVRDAISQTRELSRGLSPVRLESDGLMSALQELATNTGRMFGVECIFHCDAPVLVKNAAASTHLYRIAQEAVSNAIKHGKATHLAITLEDGVGATILTILDDGSGFKVARSGRNGLGLRIMQYRARMIGGSLSIQARPKGGVEVICSLPQPEGSSTR